MGRQENRHTQAHTHKDRWAETETRQKDMLSGRHYTFVYELNIGICAVTVLWKVLTTET